MKLAARLDRLRGGQAGTAKCAAQERSDQRRRPSAAAHPMAASEAVLAEVLGATCHDGLLVREDVHALPVSACDLRALPEMHTGDDADWVYLDTETTGLSEEKRAALRRRHIGFIFQAFHLVPRLSASLSSALPGFT